MSARTYRVALGALMTALTLVFMYISNLIPTARVAFVAAASLFVTAAVIEGGLSTGIFVAVGGGALAALFLPDKTAALLFALFFGYYPVLKSIAERATSRVLQWAVKIAVFNLAFCAVWFLFGALVFDQAVLDAPLIGIWALLNGVFVLYDIGYTKLISFYIERISKHLKKRSGNNR